MAEPVNNQSSSGGTTTDPAQTDVKDNGSETFTQLSYTIILHDSQTDVACQPFGHLLSYTIILHDSQTYGCMDFIQRSLSYTIILHDSQTPMSRIFWSL